MGRTAKEIGDNRIELIANLTRQTSKEARGRLSANESRAAKFAAQRTEATAWFRNTVPLGSKVWISDPNLATDVEQESGPKFIEMKVSSLDRNGMVHFLERGQMGIVQFRERYRGIAAE